MSGAPIPGIQPGLPPGLINTPPSTWPPLYYFGPDAPTYPALLADANAFFGKGLDTGRARAWDPRHPMMRQMGYEWAGSYLKKMWDPLPRFRGYPAAPIATPQRLGIYVRTVPVHNELGYQNVMLNDKGVPISGEPYSTPQYVFAGPIQAGYMDFVRPVADRRTLPSRPPSTSLIGQAQGAALGGPYGGGPYAMPPIQPLGWRAAPAGLLGAWPLYRQDQVRRAPRMMEVVRPCGRADANPGMPPDQTACAIAPVLSNPQENQTMQANPLFETAQNWVSPNQMARQTMSNPFGNPMPGSGPGYHGYLSTAMQGMGMGTSYNGNPTRPVGGLDVPGVQSNPAELEVPGVPRYAPPGLQLASPYAAPPPNLPYTTVGTLRQNPGGTFLARRQVVPKERGLWCRLFPNSTRCQTINASPNARAENPVTPDVRGGVVPLGVYPQWSGLRKHDHLANPHGGACCESCAIGGPCEGCGGHDGHDPQGNPCGCGGAQPNPITASRATRTASTRPLFRGRTRPATIRGRRPTAVPLGCAGTSGCYWSCKNKCKGSNTPRACMSNCINRSGAPSPGGRLRAQAPSTRGTFEDCEKRCDKKGIPGSAPYDKCMAACVDAGYI